MALKLIPELTRAGYWPDEYADINQVDIRNG
jgi:hypothetical protein